MQRQKPQGPQYHRAEPRNRDKQQEGDKRGIMTSDIGQQLQLGVEPNQHMSRSSLKRSKHNRRPPPKQKEGIVHRKALISTLILILGIGAGILLHFYLDIFQLTLQGMIGVFVASYLLYLFFGFYKNKLVQYLGNIKSKAFFDSYVVEMRDKQGFFQLKAECYHQQVVQTDKYQKDSQTGERWIDYQQRRDKKVTHTQIKQLTPTSTVDQTVPVDNLKGKGGIVFVHFKAKHYFKDTKSQTNFFKLYDQFKKQNKQDAKQDYSYKYILPGLVERRTFYIHKPTCNYKTWFYLFGAVGLLWPYSLFIQSKISRFDIQLVKIINIEA